jgi:hypothetical protein
MAKIGRLSHVTQMLATVKPWFGTSRALHRVPAPCMMAQILGGVTGSSGVAKAKILSNLSQVTPLDKQFKMVQYTIFLVFFHSPNSAHGSTACWGAAPPGHSAC